MRQFWRDMLNAVTSEQTAPLMAAYRERIAGKSAEYVERYDNCEPIDSVGIARCQEGRILCKSILDELDKNVCLRSIGRLDEEIKTLTKERDKVKPAHRAGYDSLTTRSK